MAGKEHKGDISDVFRIAESGDVSNFEGRITIRIKHLGSILDTGLTPSINEFLVTTSLKLLEPESINSPAETLYQRSCPFLLERRSRI